MDIQARKLSFIQEFLRLQNESVIEKLEKVLQKEKKQLFEENLKPMSLDEFNADIDRAVSDAAQGNVISSDELKAKMDKWR